MENRYIYPDWEIIEELGSGAFSTVYRIRKTGETDGNYDSALKVISIPTSENEYRQYKGEGYSDAEISSIFKSKVSQFVNELKLLSAFRGTTNIVSYEDHCIVPKEDGMGYYVLIKMELLTTLPDRYNQKPLSAWETVKLGVDMCDALILCEKNNIIHRDIKPQNIFINKFDSYKLGDFGIARTMDHTTRATKTGTPAYMAPEVHHGEKYNNTADIYSLGMVLYWLLNERRLPFLPLPPEVPTASQSDDALERRLNGEALPEPKHGSNELKAIVLKACAYNPADRYASAAELKNALISALATLVPEQEKTVVINKYDKKEKNKTFIIPPDNIKKEENKKVVPPTPTEEKKEERNKAQQATEKKSKKGIILVVIALLLLMLVSAIALFALGGTALLGAGLKELFSSFGGDDSSVSDESYLSEELEYSEESEAASSQEVSEEISEEASEEKTAGWTLTEGVLTVSGEGAMRDEDIAEWLKQKDDIKSVVIENGITSIGKDAFHGCGALTEIKIPASVTLINEYAFYGCAALSKVQISNRIEDIKDYAFFGCSSLKSVQIPDSVTSIGVGAFGSCAGLTQISVDSGNKGYTSIDGVLFSKDGKQLLQYPKGKDNTAYSIPYGVEIIMDNAFDGCTSLVHVSIPNSVITISSYGFCNCTNLETVSFGGSLKRIEKSAFAHCEALTSVILPRDIESIGDWAFAYCKAITDFKYNGTTQQWSNVSLSLYWKDASSIDIVDCLDSEVGISGKPLVGDVVVLGSYEQDNNSSNGKEKIEWTVLYADDSEALLISKYCLDYGKFNNNSQNAVWKESYIRSWLNESFYKDAFSSSEQAVIISGTTDTNTVDKVFLLSITEANKYLSSADDKMCAATKYATAKGAYTHPDNNGTWWWLRSAGDSHDIAARVSSSGYIHTGSYTADNDSNAIRPVIRVRIK